MDWNQLFTNDLEEIELDFNKSSKRIKMDENEMEMDLDFNLKEIQKKINTMRGEVRKLSEELNLLHLQISNF